MDAGPFLSSGEGGVDLHTRGRGMFEALTGVLRCSQAHEESEVLGEALGVRGHLGVDSRDDLQA